MYGTLTTAPTWGLDGPSFLWGYGLLCVAALATIVALRSRTLGPEPRGDDEPDEMDVVYALAMLGGGPQLTITSAATQLYRDGRLRPALAVGTLETVGTLEEQPDAIERAVFETVRDSPGITTDQMRAQVAASDAVRCMQAELESSGLLLEHGPRMTLMRRIALIGGLVGSLGIARVIAGASEDRPVLYLVVLVAAACFAMGWLFLNVPTTTRRGSAVLSSWRVEHDDLRRNPVAGHSAIAAALFGGAALWLAEPEIASALGVERESSSGGRASGGGCGGCGGGGGGCGG